mmetsp:Transcript_31087/g.69030  ORF Transcript_31087/g.69030 Transcript_31087/m.69030 type:complete len:203 (+) Transcript_31087:993-1601(+)
MRDKQLGQLRKASLPCCMGVLSCSLARGLQALSLLQQCCDHIPQPVRTCLGCRCGCCPSHRCCCCRPCEGKGQDSIHGACWLPRSRWLGQAHHQGLQALCQLCWTRQLADCLLHGRCQVHAGLLQARGGVAALHSAAKQVLRIAQSCPEQMHGVRLMLLLLLLRRTMCWCQQAQRPGKKVPTLRQGHDPKEDPIAQLLIPCL